MKEEQQSDNRHKPGPDRSVSQSVARALTVMNLIADTKEDLGVREIARRIGIAPSIVQRLLATLLAAGYVERCPDGVRYRIGHRAFQTGRAFLSKVDLRAASLPELRLMAEKERVNAYLGVMRDNAIIYIEAMQSHGPIAITSAPGSRGALHSTAFGKALLAELPNDEILRLIGPEPLPALTQKTITSVRALIEDIERVRACGYAVSDEENLKNVFSIGAVIRDASGQAIAAVSGALPCDELKTTSRDHLCRIVTDAAMRISHRLGAVGKT